MNYNPDKHLIVETSSALSNGVSIPGVGILTVLHSFVPPQQRGPGFVDKSIIVTPEGIFSISLNPPQLLTEVDVYYKHPIYETIGVAHGYVIDQRYEGRDVFTTIAIPTNGIEEIYREALLGVISGIYVGEREVYDILRIRHPFMPTHSLSGSPVVDKHGNIRAVVSRIPLTAGEDPNTALAHLPMPLLQSQIKERYRVELPENTSYILIEVVS